MAHQGAAEHYNLCKSTWSEFDMTGKDVKLGREHKGWTQEEAASRLSVSQPYLSLIEKGARPVPEKIGSQSSRPLLDCRPQPCRSKQAGRPCNPRIRTLSL